MFSKIAYPWFFFYRVARLAFLIFLPTLFALLFTYRYYYVNGLKSQILKQSYEHLLTLKALLPIENDWQKLCSAYPKQLTQQIVLTDSEGKIICQSKAPLILGPRDISNSLPLSDNVILKQVIPINILDTKLNELDSFLFLKLTPISLFSFILFLFFFYQSTIPLGNILAKVNKFKSDIPFTKNLELLYRKNEWAEVEEALNEADAQLNNQIEKVQTENEKIATILESINDDIIAIDLFESVLFYNSNFKKNFMQNNTSTEIIPKLWHKIKDESVLSAFRQVLKSGERIDLSGINFLNSDQPQRYYNLNITPLKNPEGKIIGALGVFYDITEFKLTLQMRVDFVANVSHEIRTPLTSIKGYTQLLQAQKQKIDPELHVFLEKIITNTERMISLFNDLLNLSVIESRDLTKFDEFQIENLIDEVIGNIITNFPAKKISIEKDIKLATFLGNDRLIGQVLSNLIDNACKYSNTDPSIKISTFDKDHKAYIVVSDNGPGISKEHLQRIFERFYRIDSSRETSRGTGLGLSIAKHIIAKHKGKIWAESEESRGTTFIIELPLV